MSDDEKQRKGKSSDTPPSLGDIFADQDEGEIDTAEANLAEYELTRIHREKIEEELEELRHKLDNYSKSSRRRTQRRRRENIYVLFALGIIGGFFTLYPDFKIETTFDYFATGFVGASFGFLLLKMHTVRVNSINQKTVTGKIDRLADLLFLISITGAILLASVIFLLDVFNINPTASSEALMSISLLISTLMLAYYSMRSSKSINKYADQQQRRVQKKELEVELQRAIFSFSRNVDTEGEELTVEEYIEKVQEYLEKGGEISQVEEIRNSISEVNAIPDSIRRSVDGELDTLIEEKRKENKRREELREEERSSYRQELRNRE